MSIENPSGHVDRRTQTTSRGRRVLAAGAGVLALATVPIACSEEGAPRQTTEVSQGSASSNSDTSGRFDKPSTSSKKLVNEGINVTTTQEKVTPKTIDFYKEGEAQFAIHIPGISEGDKVTFYSETIVIDPNIVTVYQDDENGRSKADAGDQKFEVTFPIIDESTGTLRFFDAIGNSFSIDMSDTSKLVDLGGNPILDTDIQKPGRDEGMVVGENNYGVEVSVWLYGGPEGTPHQMFQSVAYPSEGRPS